MQKYGLVGYPLKHSFSIGYFNENSLLKRLKQNILTLRFLILIIFRK